ncbi:MAG: FliM/FliN family flagellar motor C-terminal domain-containing protein [Pseudomonadota bacterium]
MSSVLRRKIEAASGVPPSMLGKLEFWAELRDTVETWVADTLAMEMRPAIKSRKAVKGKIALENLSEQTIFDFDHDDSRSLVAIAVSKSFLLTNAALRMGENESQLGEASPLFLKLMAGDAVQGLSTSLPPAANRYTISEPNSTTDAVHKGAQLDPEQTYLIVDMALSGDAESMKIWLIYNFELLRLQFQQPSLSNIKEKVFGKSHLTLKKSVRSTFIDMNAVLEEINCTVAQCSRFQVGDIIQLPNASCGKVKLTADTLSGRSIIANGEMGVWKTQRALKLNSQILERFVRDVASTENNFQGG